MIATYLKSLQLILPLVLLVLILLACGGGGTGGGTGGTGPGTLNATLMVHVGGNTPTACTVSQSISWTASSSAGSTQTKTSNPVTNETSRCDELTNIEGGKTISCSCPVQVSFTGLAAGDWTVQADSAGSCTGKVNAGATSTMTIYTDGRACTKFP